MDTVLCRKSIGISELREAPARAFEKADHEAVVVLNHNRPAGYIVSPRLMKCLLDALADRVVTAKAESRVGRLKRARRISLSELRASHRLR